MDDASRVGRSGQRFRSRHYPDAHLSRKEGEIRQFLMRRAVGKDALASVTVAEIAEGTRTSPEHVRVSLRHLERLGAIRVIVRGGGRGVPNTWRAPWCFTRRSWARWEARKQREAETPLLQSAPVDFSSCSRRNQEEHGACPATVKPLEVGLSSLEKGAGRWNAWVGGAETHRQPPSRPDKLPNFRILEEDLKTREGVDALWRRLVRAGWTDASERMREVVHGLVARARRVASNTCAFVAGCVRKRLWKHVSEAERAEARAEIAQLEELVPPPIPKKPWQRYRRRRVRGMLLYEDHGPKPDAHCEVGHILGELAKTLATRLDGGSMATGGEGGNPAGRAIAGALGGGGGGFTPYGDPCVAPAGGREEDGGLFGAGTRDHASGGAGVGAAGERAEPRGECAPAPAAVAGRPGRGVLAGETLIREEAGRYVYGMVVMDGRTLAEAADAFGLGIEEAQAAGTKYAEHAGSAAAWGAALKRGSGTSRFAAMRAAAHKAKEQVAGKQALDDILDGPMYGAP